MFLVISDERRFVSYFYCRVWPAERLMMGKTHVIVYMFHYVVFQLPDLLHIIGPSFFFLRLRETNFNCSLT